MNNLETKVHKTGMKTKIMFLTIRRPPIHSFLRKMQLCWVWTTWWSGPLCIVHCVNTDYWYGRVLFLKMWRMINSFAEQFLGLCLLYEALLVMSLLLAYRICWPSPGRIAATWPLPLQVLSLLHPALHHIQLPTLLLSIIYPGRWGGLYQALHLCQG